MLIPYHEGVLCVAHLLGCENIHLEYPSKKLFDAVTLGVDEGDRIGIVGGNGDGKSTLLAVLEGALAPDKGRVTRRSGVVVEILRQADALNRDLSVRDTVVGDTPEHVWASDPRIRSIIAGLCADVDWDGQVGELSGGQRRRVDLARVLVAPCDVLMLDEPTNHLDVQAITWLAEHLKTRWPKRQGALLVVTHDRWFLDEVCTVTWEVHDGRVDLYEGGYSEYILQRVEREDTARKVGQKRQNLMRKELAWLSRRPQARTTKPKFRIDAAHALIDDEPPVRDALELKRTAMSRLGKQVVDLLDVTQRFGDNTVIDDVTWHIGPGDRFGIVGVNGSGKTTLLRLIQGVLEPTSGQVKIGQTVKFAYLSQHLAELEGLADLRVREVLARYNTRYEIDGRELSPSQLLERLGFSNAHLSAYVRDLSGGQKRRLQLMLVLLDRPNVLILDEPDNDLDTDMLTVVEGLLDTWPGTLLLITHDRHLMERVTDDQFAVIGGTVRHLPGGVDEYLRLLEQRGQATSATSNKKPATVGSAESASVVSQAERRRLKKELASVERKLETAGARANDARGMLADTAPSDYVALLEAQARLDEAERRVSELEDEWLKLSELLS
jgi:ATPase subunit of ABC transporter with duplicated ATPase domains